MKKLSASLLAITLLLFGNLYVAAQEQAAKPTFKEGDTWQFNVTRMNLSGAESTEQLEGIYELNFTQGKIKAFSVNGSQKEEINLDPKSAPSQTLLSLLASSEQQQSIRFPLRAGQKYAYNYEVTPSGSRNTTRRAVEVNVTGIEQVTIPAGTFKAYKLVREETWTTAGRYGQARSLSATYFFSLDTKSVIKSSSESSGAKLDIELIKFTPAD